MSTKEIQALDHALEELDDKIENHDCKYEDGCPCYDWMLESYNTSVKLHELTKTDEEINNEITLAKELAHDVWTQK